MRLPRRGAHAQARGRCFLPGYRRPTRYRARALTGVAVPADDSEYTKGKYTKGTHPMLFG